MNNQQKKTFHIDQNISSDKICQILQIDSKILTSPNIEPVMPVYKHTPLKKIKKSNITSGKNSATRSNLSHDKKINSESFHEINNFQIGLHKRDSFQLSNLNYTIPNKNKDDIKGDVVEDKIVLKRVKQSHKGGGDFRENKMKKIIQKIQQKNQKNKNDLEMDKTSLCSDDQFKNLKNFNMISNLVPANLNSKFSNLIKEKTSRDSSDIKTPSKSNIPIIRPVIQENRSISSNMSHAHINSLYSSYIEKEINSYEINIEIFKKFTWKYALGIRLLKLGKFKECINVFNGVASPLDTSHFVLINTAIAYMHLVKYKNAEKLFEFAFKREPYESYGLDFYR